MRGFPDEDNRWGLGLPIPVTNMRHTCRRRVHQFTLRWLSWRRLMVLTVLAVSVSLYPLASSQLPSGNQDQAGANAAGEGEATPEAQATAGQEPPAEEEPPPAPEGQPPAPPEPVQDETIEVDDDFLDDVANANLPEDPPPPPRPGPLNDEAQATQRLNAGDVISIRFHDRPHLNRLSLTIAPDGTISYLQAKQVKVAGLTIPEIRQKLEGQLSEDYNEPRLMIAPGTVGSRRFTILGMVEKNGTYALNRRMRILEALAMAGGISLSEEQGVGLASDFRRSFLVRDGQKLDIDFERLYLNGDLSQNVSLQSGDYIYIASNTRHQCYALGAVNSVSAVPVRPGLTVMGVITSAGGYSDLAWKGKVLLVRGSLAKPEVIVVNTAAILKGQTLDVPVEPGDIIYVNQRPFVYGERLLDTAIKAFIRGALAGAIDDEIGIGI